MKFVTVWSYRPENRDQGQARFKQIGGDKPPAGIKLIGRWHALAGGKGVHVCECDDAMALAKWVQNWTDILSVEIYPAMDDEDAVKFLS